MFLKNSTKFTGKRLCWSLFYKRVSDTSVLIAAFPTFQIEMLEIAFLTPQTLCAFVFASPTVHREMFFWRPFFSLFFCISQLPPTRQRKPHFLEIRNKIKALESDKKLLQQQVTALA